MGCFEFDSIYGIFGKESVLDLFSSTLEHESVLPVRPEEGN